MRSTKKKQREKQEKCGSSAQNGGNVLLDSHRAGPWDSIFKGTNPRDWG
jgi:hypothetical protein